MTDRFTKDTPAPIALVNAESPPQSGDCGQLYVVATPIGNLGDISHRALDVLAKVECILAEDTRHSKRLLSHYGINRRLRSCHEHNEESLVGWVKSQLSAGLDLALISDAGTPLISDPGFLLVRALREAGYAVIAVPGPSSIIAALSVSGLPTDGFVYDGFLPAKSTARQTALQNYRNEHRTIVVLESSHRIVACLQDIVSVLGPEQIVTLARELTKRFETVLSGAAEVLLATLLADEDQTRGEFVVLLAGAPAMVETDFELRRTLEVLTADLPLKQAAGLAAQLTGRRKNDAYEMALTIRKERDA